MRIHPALRPWAWTLLWLAAIWSCIWMVTASVWPRIQNQTWTESLHDQLDFLRVSDEISRLDVLTLGDSLLVTSLPRSERFNRLLGDQVSWIHLAEGAADWEDFEPLIDEYAKLHPQLIIVQAQILRRGHVDDTDFVEKARQSLYQVSNLRGIKKFISPLSYSTNVNSKLYEEEKFTPNYQPEQSLPAALLKRRDLYKIARNNDDMFLEFLHRLKLISDNVIVLYFPPSQSYDPTNPDRDWIDYIKPKLEEIDIDLITLGDPLPDHLYADGRHINRWGREYRIESFLKLLEARM